MDAFRQDTKLGLRQQRQDSKLDQRPNRQQNRTFLGSGKAAGLDRQPPY
jgi:hypothetical protein